MLELNVFGYQLNKVSIRSCVDVVGANQSSSGHISLKNPNSNMLVAKNMITGKYKCIDGDSDPSIPILNPSARFCSMKPKKTFVCTSSPLMIVFIMSSISMLFAHAECMMW